MRSIQGTPPPPPLGNVNLKCAIFGGKGGRGIQRNGLENNGNLVFPTSRGRGVVFIGHDLLID